MARKKPEDFIVEDGNIDYRAYAKYLDSAECANDDNYDILVDVQSGNIYERTDGDWTKGHGHKNVFNGYNRDKDSKSSSSDKHPWRNPWLEYNSSYVMTDEEYELVKSPKKLIKK